MWVRERQYRCGRGWFEEHNVWINVAHVNISVRLRIGVRWKRGYDLSVPPAHEAAALCGGRMGEFGRCLDVSGHYFQSGEFVGKWQIEGIGACNRVRQKPAYEA